MSIGHLIRFMGEIFLIFASILVLLSFKANASSLDLDSANSISYTPIKKRFVNPEAYEYLLVRANLSTLSNRISSKIIRYDIQKCYRLNLEEDFTDIECSPLVIRTDFQESVFSSYELMQYSKSNNPDHENVIGTLSLLGLPTQENIVIGNIHKLIRDMETLLLHINSESIGLAEIKPSKWDKALKVLLSIQKNLAETMDEIESEYDQFNPVKRKDN